MWVLHDWLSFEDFSDLTFIYWLASIVKLEFILASTHAKNLEAVNLGDKSGCRHHLLSEVLHSSNTQVRKLLIKSGDLGTYLEEYVRETGSEICSIDIELLLPRQVNIDATWAVHFNS